MSYNLGRIDPDQRHRRYADQPRERYADEYDEDPPPRPRRLLAAGAALLVMGLFAGGLWLAYVEGLHHSSGAGNGSDIPLIRADTRPMKVKPANPGGMAIPDRDMLLYGEGRPGVEHLLPPPEQPMARPAPPPPPVEAVPSLPTPVIVGTASAETVPGRLGADAFPVPAAAQTTAAAPAKPVGVRLQLGSVRSEGSARIEWARISRDNHDLLGNLSAIAIRADLGDKGVYYRIETAPVADMARANRICGQLRQRHLGCMIVR